MNSPHKGSVTRKLLPFDDVIMDFHRNSDLTEISHNFDPNSNQFTAMNICTQYDSFAVPAYANISSDTVTKNGITMKRNFHFTYIT